MRRRLWLWWSIGALFIGGVVCLAAITWVGGSTRSEPSATERFVARRARLLAMGSTVRTLTNPVMPTAEVLADARHHFADHCAICHANDGSGRTTIGRNLYPKPPDLRDGETQRLTDGQLYHIIQNGVRLTGMPAWADEGDHNDEDTWKLVHLIRRFNELTPEQLREMKRLNPKTREEIEQEKEDEQFLEGRPASPSESSQTHTPVHTHSH